MLMRGNLKYIASVCYCSVITGDDLLASFTASHKFQGLHVRTYIRSYYCRLNT